MSNQMIGVVNSVDGFILTLTGLANARLHSIIKSQAGSVAQVVRLQESLVSALVLKSEETINPGVVFTVAQDNLEIPEVGSLMGRIINPIGETIDAQPPISSPDSIKVEFEKPAYSVTYRADITTQLATGILGVDSLLPIAKGQRQLIFGSPRSGKTIFLQNAIEEHIHNEGVAVYGLIGKTTQEILEIAQNLTQTDSLKNTIIVASTIEQSAALGSIVPNVTLAIAESFRNKGRHVLAIIDDMGVHARILREISLLMNIMPGREAYPGDIFYQQSHLIEHAGCFNEKLGSGTITLFPVIETDMENFTNLIPTNLMACTDGHLLFSAELKAKGYTPAIDFFTSVTRVGKKTQPHLLSQLAQMARSQFILYKEVTNYGLFATDIGQRTQEIIKDGQKIDEIYNQESTIRIPTQTQIILLAFIFSPSFKTWDLETVKKRKSSLIELFNQSQYQAHADQCQSANDLIKIMDEHFTEIDTLTAKTV